MAGPFDLTGRRALAIDEPVELERELVHAIPLASLPDLLGDGLELVEERRVSTLNPV